MQFVPNKLYYKIREVSEIVGVEAHVLRFWETEFPTLSPPKSKSGQRTYRPKDIVLLLRIRELLYDEGFTIPGARKQLGAKSPAVASETEPPAPRSKNKRRQTESKNMPTPKSDRINKVKSELENILTLLDRD
jgi:DNA-binding transcriptional MerR regulator